MSKVQLTIFQKTSHYLFPFLMFFLGCIPLYFLIAGETNENLTGLMVVCATSFFWLLAAATCYKQIKELGFYAIPTDRPININLKIIKEILQKHNWHVTKSSSNFIQAQGSGFKDSFDLRSWGELLTIEIKPNEIKVNSICDPDAHFPQIISFGKNKQNIKDFETLYLQKANNDIKA